MQFTRRQFAIGTAAASIAPAWAQNYPSKPITIVVGFAAGGGIDFVMRSLAPGLQQRLGQTVIVDNRPGAGGTLAATYVARAAPDGYTLLPSDAATLALNGALFSKLTYDPAELVPISFVIRAPILIVAHPSAPFSDLRGLIDHAKRQPGGISYASPGNGTMHQLAMEQLRLRGGFPVTSIQYKGAGAAIVDILSGQVPVGPIDTIVALPHVTSGKLKVLAALTPKRIPQLPNVPTAAEAGVEDAVAYPWIGLSAPKGTPANVIARLNSEVREVLTSPEISKKFTDLGMEPLPMTPEQFDTFVKQEVTRWHPLIKQLNIRLD
jgi:tripartite-type tricarboxylate transporter receptor subunit TctC